MNIYENQPTKNTVTKIIKFRLQEFINIPFHIYLSVHQPKLEMKAWFLSFRHVHQGKLSHSQKDVEFYLQSFQ